MGLGKLSSDSSGTISLPWCNYFYNLEHSREDLVRCLYEGSNLLDMVIGALPQLIISAIYIAVNYQLTVMIHLRDWTRLALRKQPLRVSDPEPDSAQVSTYWLSLPYRYSIPLLISSVAFSWLVSQSLFYYRFTWYDNDGLAFKVPDVYERSRLVARVEHGLGYSALGIICSIVFGLIVFGVSLAIGLRKCAPGLSLGPTNSFVIATACHPPENDRHAAKKPVKWGAIRTDDDIEQQVSLPHCTITSRRVEHPVEGRYYA